MRRSAGFTLIELVIVIVVLGVLAALAIPRFISLQREARIAVIDSLFGSTRSGSNLVYAKSAVIGQSGAATGSVDIDGPAVTGGVVNTVFGYPEATSAAMTLLFDNLSPRYTFSTSSAGSVRMEIDGIPTCSVTYTAPTAAGADGTKVSVTVSAPSATVSLMMVTATLTAAPLVDSAGKVIDVGTVASPAVAVPPRVMSITSGALSAALLGLLGLMLRTTGTLTVPAPSVALLVAAANDTLTASIQSHTTQSFAVLRLPIYARCWYSSGEA